MMLVPTKLLVVVALGLLSSTFGCAAPTGDEPVGSSASPLLSPKQRHAQAVRAVTRDLRDHVEQRPALADHEEAALAMSAKVDALSVNAERLARAVGLGADAAPRSMHSLYYPPEDGQSVTTLVEIVMNVVESLRADILAMQRQNEADMAAAAALAQQQQLEAQKDAFERERLMREWLARVSDDTDAVAHNWTACRGPAGCTSSP